MQSQIKCFGCEDYIHIFPSYKCVQNDSIGSGANGSAFLVSKDGVTYVLKVQPTSEKSKKELSFLEKLKGIEGIVQVYEKYLDSKKTYIIIQYGSQGTLLNQIMNMNFKNNYEFSIRVMKKLITAVREMHLRNVVHADLKPENIVMDEDNNPIIIDFDLATGLNEMNWGRGTKSYMAPEIVKTITNSTKVVYDEKIDIYSLGVIFYAMVTGKYPLKLKVINYNDMMEKVISFEVGSRKFLFDLTRNTVCLKQFRMSDDEMYESLAMQDLKPDLTVLDEIKTYQFTDDKLHREVSNQENEIFERNGKGRYIEERSDPESKYTSFTAIEIAVVIILGIMLISVLILIIWFSRKTEKKFVSPSFTFKKTQENLNIDDDRRTNITFSN